MAEAPKKPRGFQCLAAALATGGLLALGDALFEPGFALEGLRPDLIDRGLAFCLLPALGGLLAALFAMPILRTIWYWTALPALAFGWGQIAARGGQAQAMPLAAYWGWLLAGASLLVLLWMTRSKVLTRHAWLPLALGSAVYLGAAHTQRGLYEELRAWTLGITALSVFSGWLGLLPKISGRALAVAAMAVIVLASFGASRMRDQDLRDWADVSTTSLAPIAKLFDFGADAVPTPEIPEETLAQDGFFGTPLAKNSLQKFEGDRGPIKRVLFLVIDALRADMLGRDVAGRPVTPVLDELAKEAVVFENAYTPAPYSQLSLISMFSGLYPGRAVERLENEVAEPFIAHRLRRQGISTLASTSTLAMQGPVKVLKDPSLGFEHIAHAPDLNLPMDLCFDWVKRKAADARWFAYLHVFYPHAPYEPKAEFRAGDSEFELYAGAIREADFMLGQLVAGMKKDGLWDDTLLIVAADHGEEFFEHGRQRHGHNLYRESTHVPLYLLGGRLEPRRVKDLVSLIDLAPTLAQVFDLKARNRPVFQGRSWLPLAFGLKDPGRSLEVVVEVPSFGGARTLPARTAIISATHSFTVDERRQRFYLYDLRVDPGEKTNLASQQKELARRLWGRALAVRDRKREQSHQAEDLFAELSQNMMDYNGQRRIAIAMAVRGEGVEHTAASRMFGVFALSKRYLPLEEFLERMKSYPDREVQDSIATLRVVLGQEKAGDRDCMDRLWRECDDAIVLAAVAEGFRRVGDRRLLEVEAPEVRTKGIILELATMAYEGSFGRPVDAQVLERGLMHELVWVRHFAARMAAAARSPLLKATIHKWRSQVKDPKLKHELNKAHSSTRARKKS